MSLNRTRSSRLNIGRRIRFRSGWSNRLGAGLLLAIVIVLVTGMNYSAQQDCSDVPLVEGRIGWSRRIVYYDLQFSGSGALPRGAIEAINKAFAEATRAFGNTGLQFRQAVTEAQKTDAANNGIRVVRGALDRNKGEAATTAVGYLPDPATGLSYTINATITYDFSNSAVYDVRDLARMQAYIYKVTLHEIGHTLGLDDHADSKRWQNCHLQTPGRTVVNDACDKHDASNRMATTFTPCDLARITLGAPGVSCCTESGFPPPGGSGPGPQGPIGGGHESCRPEIPGLDDCTNICNGHLSYWAADSCGGYWGDWCLALYGDSFPKGDLVCEVSTVIKLTASLDLVSGAAPGPQVSLRTVGGHFVSAESGGWGGVNAVTTANGAHETFVLEDLNGGTLSDGDPVALRTAAGAYLQAVHGGGGTVSAQGGGAWSWETFTIVSLDFPGQVVAIGDRIALQSSAGYYLVAEGGGGGAVNANRTALGPWETFSLEYGTGGGHNPGPGGQTEADVLYPGQALQPDQGLTSSNGQYRLVYQGDGNLVLYEGTVALWASNTNGTVAGVAVMQHDGNFVIYDGYWAPIRHTGTWWSPGAYLVLQNDSNLVLYNAEGYPLWDRHVPW